MAGTTVIDQLIVKLGLDPREFTKGEKQAAAETVRLKETVKTSTDDMGRNFAKFTGKVVGLATAAIAVKKFIAFTSELSTNLRQLGLDADNYHVAANELRNFGNIAAMNGGKADDATKSIAGLNKAMYDLAYNGQISDSLIMLGRLGVQFQDTAGNMREFRSIALDTQNAIQQRMSQGMSRANAYQMLQQAGFDPGLSNAMLSGTLAEQLARQEQRRQVSGENVRNATRWEQSAVNRSQSIDAAALRPFDREARVGTSLNDSASAAVDVLAGTESLSKASDRVREAVPMYDKAIRGTADVLEWAADTISKARMNSFPRGRNAYEGTIQQAAKKYGIDPEVLAGVLSTESQFNPRAVNGTSGATGIAQLMPKYFPGAGNNPHADIYTSAEYLRKLYDAEKKRDPGADDAGLWSLTLMDYNAGQSRVRRSMQPGGKPLTDETLEYPGKVMDYAGQAIPTPNAQGGAGSRSDITFEQVTINTSRTDGEGVATEFVGSVDRKLSAAQADTGVQ